MMIRCSKCNKLLFKIRLNGHLEYEIICPKCKFKMNEQIQMNEDIKSFRSFKKRQIDTKE